MVPPLVGDIFRDAKDAFYPLVQPPDRRNGRIPPDFPARSGERAVPQGCNLAAGRAAVPPWLEVDVNDKKGTVRGLPMREDIQIPVQEQLIVELFSK